MEKCVYKTAIETIKFAGLKTHLNECFYSAAKAAIAGGKLEMKVCTICQRCYEDADAVCEANHGSLAAERSGSPSMIANYVLDVLLERGANGETYRATHAASNQSFVVKIVSLNSASEAAEQTRRILQAEAQSAVSIDHPNVARVYEAGFLEAGDFYTIGELVEGQSLRQYLTISGGALGESEAVAVARQTAQALEAAHQVGVVHRAVNPSNIIVSSVDGNQLSVKLRNFDFGAIEEQTILASVSSPQMPFEAIRYLSPEQCSAQTADARTDVYSLGVVLYEMLCGRASFDAPSQSSIISKAFSEQPFERFRYDVRALLTYVLKQSLEKSLAARLPSAGNFVSQLRQIERLVAPPPATLRALTQNAPSVQTVSDTANAAEIVFQPETDETPLPIFQPHQATAQENVIDLTPQISMSPVLAESPVAEVKVPASDESNVFVEQEPILIKRKVSDVESFAAEPIPVKRKEAAAAAFESHPIPVRKRQTADAPLAFEPIRIKRKEPVVVQEETFVSAVEPETDVSPVVYFEQARKTPTPVAKTPALAQDFSYLNEEHRQTRRFAASRRPLFVGAGLLALLSALGLGMFLYNQQQQNSEPSIAAATPPRHNSAAEVTAASESQTDVSENENDTPVINEKPTETSARRENQVQPRVETPDANNVAAANEPIKNQTLIAKTAENNPPSDSNGNEQNELNASLNEWVTATNERDIDRQMGYYAPKVDSYYRTRNVSPDAVRAEKKQIFERARAVDIQTGKPEIAVSPDGRSATMRFRKKYAIKEGEKNRSGEVIQELRWVKSGKSWKIVSERDIKVINR